MNSGLTFCFLGALSFGLLGCASKFAERRNCQASVLVVFLCGWAMLVMLVRSAGLPSPLSLPMKAVAVAVICGICAAVAYFCFQYSIAFGKVSVAWLMVAPSPVTENVCPLRWKYSATMLAFQAPPDAVTNPVTR